MHGKTKLKLERNTLQETLYCLYRHNTVGFIVRCGYKFSILQYALCTEYITVSESI